MWEAITAGAEQGRGVLVTTHHLAEAEQCDRLVVMATGRVVAAGTLTEVIGDATTVVVRGTDAPATLTALERAGMLPTLAAGGVAVPAVRLDEVLAAVEDAGLAGDGTAVVTRPSTLEERFVELVTA
jgi:ABC-type multidrug transport system ATPase subunit